jgi:hypothetical protein
MIVLQFRTSRTQVRDNVARQTRPSLVTMLLATLVAWWHRPAHPPDLPPHLRADVGLPPERLPLDWRGMPYRLTDPMIVRAWKR